MYFIEFVSEQDKTRKTVDAQIGVSIMENAVTNHIKGILAECGGACSCATCHVHIDSVWRNLLPAPTMMELDMLDFAFDINENSRLACQIIMTEALDGIVINVPAKQG